MSDYERCLTALALELPSPVYDDVTRIIRAEVERLRARVSELELEKREIASLHYSQSAVEELIAAAVAAFKEDAIVATCPYCRAGSEAVNGDHYFNNPEKGQSPVRMRCYANGLRALPASRESLDRMLAEAQTTTATIHIKQAERDIAAAERRGQREGAERGIRWACDDICGYYRDGIVARGLAALGLDP